ncbi:LCP family protein [Brevibacterium samyangense]|uniref:Cell envelope-related transcriptional attenuator domain-containing protein n=1 Tax=Brevibacterium samyangense TaxID=366888 RepID=A0ABP5F327_9MICO
MTSPHDRRADLRQTHSGPATTPHALSPSPRASRFRRAFAPTASVLALALVAGCSGGADDTGTPEPVFAETTTVAELPTVTTGFEDADLGALVEGWYRGEDVAHGDAVADAAEARTTRAGSITVDGATGTWNGTQIAVLTTGEDVTLAVGPAAPETAGDGEDDGEDSEDTTVPAEWTVVGGWWPGLGLDEPALGEGARHLLFVGADAREKEGESITNTRADAIQMVGVDGEGGAAVVGIPRDLWVPLESGREAKLNAALVFDGPEGQQQAVTNATGIEFDGYVLTGFEGFKAIVEDAGGLPVDSPKTVKEVSEGESTLDPDTALMYVRERKTLSGGDFDRSFHQGIALLGFAGAALGKGPTGLVDSLSLVDPHVETNVSAEDMLTFAAWTYRVDLAQVGHDVPDAPYGTSSDGQSILVNDDGVKAVFEDFSDGNLDG